MEILTPVNYNNKYIDTIEYIDSIEERVLIRNQLLVDIVDELDADGQPIYRVTLKKARL